jgi:starch synthase
VRIVHVVSELVGSQALNFGTTGGLGKVPAGLAAAQARRGDQPVIIIPHHKRFCPDIDGAPKWNVDTRLGPCVLTETRLPVVGVDVPVYLVGNDAYFDRPALYRDKDGDYSDNNVRFAFFCFAALSALRAIGLQPDMVHTHDWQTALIPFLVKQPGNGFPGTATTHTIHNGLFKGEFPRDTLSRIGLSEKLLHPKALEFHGQVSYTQAAIYFADWLTTVSTFYRNTLLTEARGCGLHGAYQHRKNNFTGIVNGLDPSEYNPMFNPYLLSSLRFDPSTVVKNKPLCKAQLQTELELPVDPAVASIGFIGRLSQEKGIHLILAAMGTLMDTTNIQFVALGTGDQHFENALLSLQTKYPDRVRAILKYEEKIAYRLLYPGLDAIIAPSSTEPCGLVHLAAMGHGTIPCVHAIDGLGETVRDWVNSDANGIMFDKFTADALLQAIKRTLTLLSDPAEHHRVQLNGMERDSSWRYPAQRYSEIYEQALENLT